MDNLIVINMNATKSSPLHKTSDMVCNDCDICGVELDNPVTLKCNHTFCYACVLEWYIECQNRHKNKSQAQYIRRSCPYCKSNGGHLPRMSETEPYLKDIHMLSHKSRTKNTGKKIKMEKTITASEAGIELVTGYCQGIAKSTGKQCKMYGKYNGYCHWHKNQALSAT